MGSDLYDSSLQTIPPVLPAKWRPCGKTRAKGALPSVALPCAHRTACYVFDCDTHMKSAFSVCIEPAKALSAQSVAFRLHTWNWISFDLDMANKKSARYEAKNAFVRQRFQPKISPTTLRPVAVQRLLGTGGSRFIRKTNILLN